jgi:ankyrin repeat protein
MPPKKGEDPTTDLGRLITALKNTGSEEDRAIRISTITDIVEDKFPDVFKVDAHGNNAFMKFAAKPMYDEDEVNTYYRRHTNDSDKDDIYSVTEDAVHAMRDASGVKLDAKNRAGKTVIDIAFESGNLPVIDAIFSDKNRLKGSFADELEAGLAQLKAKRFAGIPRKYVANLIELVDDAKKEKAKQEKAARQANPIRNYLAGQGKVRDPEDPYGYKEEYDSVREAYDEFMDRTQRFHFYRDVYAEKPVAGAGGGGGGGSFVEEAMKSILVDYYMEAVNSTLAKENNSPLDNIVGWNPKEEPITRQEAVNVISHAMNLIIGPYNAAHGVEGGPFRRESAIVNDTVAALRAKGKTDAEIHADLVNAHEIVRDEFVHWRPAAPLTIRRKPKLPEDTSAPTITIRRKPKLPEDTSAPTITIRRKPQPITRNDSSSSEEEEVPAGTKARPPTPPRTKTVVRGAVVHVLPVDAIRSLGQFLWRRFGGNDIRPFERLKWSNNTKLYKFSLKESQWDEYWKEISPLTNQIVSYEKVAVLVNEDRTFHIIIQPTENADHDIEKVFGGTLMNEPERATIRAKLESNNVRYFPKKKEPVASVVNAAAPPAPPKGKTPSPPPPPAPPKSKTPSPPPPPAATAIVNAAVAATPSKASALLARKRNASAANTQFFNAMKAGNFVEALHAMPAITSIKLKDADSNYAIHFLAINTPKADQGAAYKQIIHKYLEADPEHFQNATNKDGDTPFGLAFMSDNTAFINTLIELINDMPVSPGLDAIRSELRDFAGALGANATPLTANLRNAFGRLKGGGLSKRTRRR